MINSTVIDYCQSVKDENILIQKSNFSMRVVDGNSPLIPLTEASDSFLYETSHFEGDQYMIREEVAEKLARINNVLRKENRALYIKALWRSPLQQAEISVQAFELLRTLHPKKTVAQINAIVSYFVPSQYQSMHRTGGAVEALIYDLETHQILDFGSNCGDQIDLDVTCYPHYPDLSHVARKNRNVLIQLFEQEGFVVSPIRYFHFDYGNVAWASGKNHEHAIYGPIFN